MLSSRELERSLGKPPKTAVRAPRRGRGLRPERIQLRRGVTAVLERRPDPRRRGLSAEAIEAHLAGLPGWRLAADRRSISCALSFPAYPLAVVFLNLITGLAELSGYYPDIAVRGARVSLRLVAPRGGGLTADVFGFARTLEDAGALGRARWAPGGRAGEAGA